MADAIRKGLPVVATTVGGIQNEIENGPDRVGWSLLGTSPAPATG